MNDDLLRAVQAYTGAHVNLDGLAISPVPGLRMMCVDSPRGRLESTYRPLVCMVLQGTKHLLVGKQVHVCTEGQAVIVGADLPVTGQVVEATPEKPYIALAIELDMPLVAELSQQLVAAPAPTDAMQSLFTQDVDAAAVDCARRMMHLIGHPEAIPVLYPGLLRELHFWLLSGPNGPQLRALMAPSGIGARLTRAIGALRATYRDKMRVDDLAAIAAMSTSAFHKHFKDFTSLTPTQYQKRLRLIEARRLMLYEGLNANTAAFQVGYESVSQFTREYGRLFGAPPKRDARRPVPLAVDSLAAAPSRAGDVPIALAVG